MQRYDFYFGQLVQDSDLDNAFEGAEQADLALIRDQGLTGISQGLAVAEVTPTPNLNVVVEAGTAYDQDGRRVFVPSSQIVNLTSSLPVTPGNQRYVSVAVRFARNLSDPRTDDNSVTVQYNRAESFEVFLINGPEAASSPARPSKPASGLVCADVLLTQGQTQIQTANIDMATTGRRDWVFDFTGPSYTPVSVASGNLSGFADEIITALNQHINNVGTSHPATAVSFSPVGTPSSLPNTLSAATVQAAIAGLVSDLVSTSSNDGARALGVDGTGAQFTTGTLRDVLLQLGSLAGVNDWTGDNTFDSVDVQASRPITVVGADTNANRDTAVIDTRNITAPSFASRRLFLVAAGALRTVRVYISGRGVEITTNAVFNSTTSMWSRDTETSGSILWRFETGFTQVFRSILESPTWTDLDWNSSNHGFFDIPINSAGVTTRLSPGGFESPGPVTGLVAGLSGYNPIANTVFAVSVPFPVIFPSIPSNIVISNMFRSGGALTGPATYQVVGPTSATGCMVGHSVQGTGAYTFQASVTVS